jgi:hypothetical protein
LISSGLRFLAIEVLQTVSGKRNHANPAIAAHYRAGGRLSVKPVPLQKPAMDGRPEPAAHQWIDLRQTVSFQDVCLCRPFPRARPEHPTGDFRLVGIQRELGARS